MKSIGRGDDRLLPWRRIGIVTLVTLTMAAGAYGCGGDDGSEGSDSDSSEEVEVTPENEVEGAIIVFYGDDKEAGCGILSTDALEEIGGIEKCLGNAADPVGTKVKVEDIEIDGETATATAYPKGGAGVPFELVNEDGQWLIQSPVPLIF